MSTTVRTTYIFRLTGRPGDSPEVPARDIFIRLVGPDDRDGLLDAAEQLVHEHATQCREDLGDKLGVQAFKARLLGELLPRLDGHAPEHDEPRLFAHAYTSAYAYVTRASVYFHDGELPW